MRKKSIIIIFLFIFSIFLFFINVDSVLLAENLLGLDETGKGVGYKTEIGTKQLPAVIGFVIRSILAFVGVVFMVIILMGAFDVQGAGGNEEALLKGKNKIKNGAIGLTIIFSAYIASFVLLNWLTSGVFKVN